MLADCLSAENKRKEIITIVYNSVSYVYKFRMNLILELQKIGYKVIVIAPKDQYVVELNNLGIEHYHINMSQYGMNPIKELKTILEIYNAFKKYKPAYSLHYNIKPNIFAGIAAKFTKVKVINNIAGLGKAFSDENSLFSRFIGLLYKFALKKSKKVFFQNNDDMNLFLNREIVSIAIAERIPGSGVELQKYKANKKGEGLNNFLFVGRLLIEKGIVFYLEAALKVLKKHPDYHFSIVGELEEREEYISNW